MSYGRFKVLEAILKIPFDFFFLDFSMSFMMHPTTKKSKNNSHFLGNGMHFAI